MKHFLLSTAVAALGFMAVTVAPTLALEPLRVGETWLTNGLDPANGSNGWALVSHGVGENLFTVNKDGVLTPDLASGATRIDDSTWEIAIAPNRHYSDGTPVTAASVAEGLTHTFATNKTALATGGMIEFTAIDDSTLKIATERPVAAIEALFAEWPLVIYRLKDDGSAVFTGPYEITNFTADQSADLVPNQYFPGADQRSPVSLQKFGDAQTLALAFEAGELDLAFGLPSEVLPRLKADPELIIKSFPVGYQYLAFINTKHPGVDDVRVRQAIDKTIDRDQLIAAINGGTPATGAYAPYFPFAGKTARTTDLDAAKALLDEAGWTVGADGNRSKDGAPLHLKVLAYSSRPDLVTMLPVVKAALNGVGITVDTAVVENANQVGASGEFDIFLWAQHTAPSGDPAFFLNSMLRGGANLNYSGYASPEFDAILAKFGTESAADQRNQIAAEAQDLLFKDVPVSFLVSPDWHVGLSPRLENYEPWGSDYYVLRGDIGEQH